jgi:hypothetical protein
LFRLFEQSTVDGVADDGETPLVQRDQVTRDHGADSNSVTGCCIDLKRCHHAALDPDVLRLCRFEHF